jgi:hypothetical protein
MRLKIIAGNLAVVVLLGVITFLTVRGGLRTELVKEIDNDIENSQILLERSFRLSAVDFMKNVAERAESRQIRDVFAGLDDNSRRTRAFEGAEAVFQWMGDPARGRRGLPDIVVVVDETGTVLARNGARNVMVGKALISELPALAGVLKKGEVTHDVWLERNEKKLLQAAMAPIRGGTGTIFGALVVGYDLSNAVAAAEAKVLGRDVAFVIKDRVYGSSLPGELPRELKGYLFGAGKDSIEAILQGGMERGQLWFASLAGDSYVGISARLPMSLSFPVAYVVLGNRTAKMALASKADVILYMLVLGAVLVIVYGFLIGTAIVRPIERIEEGVLAVINGRTDLRLETDNPELGGLAYRINQLLNVFTGTEEQTEDADGRVSVSPAASDAWKDAAFADAPAGTGAAAAGGAADGEEVIDDPGLAAKLAAEGEKEYGTRVFKEYVAAKKALGENVSNITMDRFLQRLTGRAEALAKQYGSRTVRFQVQTRGNQVVLRPVLIR